MYNDGLDRKQWNRINENEQQQHNNNSGMAEQWKGFCAMENLKDGWRGSNGITSLI